VDKDGKLSGKELVELYLKFYPLEEAREKVKGILEQVDADNNGYIDFSEFIMATVRKD